MVKEDEMRFYAVPSIVASSLEGVRKAEMAMVSCLREHRCQVRRTRVFVNAAEEEEISSIEVPGVRAEMKKEEMDNESSCVKETEQIPIVFVGGLGAGAALFYKNMDVIAAQTGNRVIAVDWLGCGSSSRPRSFVKGKFNDEDARITAALNFFIDAFEEWRSAMGLERFDIIGHSFGGHLAGHIAARYRGLRRIRKLVLVSAWGVPSLPTYSSRSRTSTNDIKDKNEATPHLHRTMKRKRASSLDSPLTCSPPTTSSSSNAASSFTGSWLRAPPILSGLSSLLLATGLSPLSLMRGTSFIFGDSAGHSLMSTALKRRLGSVIRDPDEFRRLCDYVYAINATNTGIERSFAALMRPSLDIGYPEKGFYARRPLETVLHQIRDDDVDVSFVYGERDWMWSHGAQRVISSIEADVHFCPGGHLMYIECHKSFNTLLANILLQNSDSESGSSTRTNHGAHMSHV